MATLETFSTEHNQDDFTATYSAEDDKLRVYIPYRIEEELYRELKAAGFGMAYTQGCMFAKWTPKREDICNIMAGDIEAEESTLAERAEAKAERLDGYRQNRLRDANAFQKSAQHYSERFANGQPILAGHHSQRGAEVAKKRMDNAQSNAAKQLSTADYWSYRARGVELHAEYKNNPRVRQGRIKTLLKELRDHQRVINHKHHALGLWKAISEIENEVIRNKKIEWYAGAHTSEGGYGYYGAYDDLRDEKQTHQYVLEQSIKAHQRGLESDYHPRWMNHILNRLGYETAMLGEIARYEGELTPVILQAFCRTHGADKPKAKKTENGFVVSSSVMLPAHIAQGETLELSGSEWRLLMQDCGYSVVLSKPRKTVRNTTPLLNIDTDILETSSLYGETNKYQVERITKEEYKRVRTDDRQVRISACKQFKFKTVFRSGGERGSFRGGYWCAVYITDSKTHPMPEALENILN